MGRSVRSYSQPWLPCRWGSGATKRPGSCWRPLWLCRMRGDEKRRARLLTILAPRLTEAQMEQALKAALGVKDVLARAEVLIALIPRLTGEQREQGLEAALALPPWAPVELLIALAPLLRKEQL